MLKTAGVNASEEAITEVVNIVYDRYALGNKSNYELAVREFMQMQKEENLHIKFIDTLKYNVTYWH